MVWRDNLSQQRESGSTTSPSTPSSGELTQGEEPQQAECWGEREHPGQPQGPRAGTARAGAQGSVGGSGSWALLGCGTCVSTVCSCQGQLGCARAASLGNGRWFWCTAQGNQGVSWLGRRMFPLLSHQMECLRIVAAREAEAADCICLGYRGRGKMGAELQVMWLADRMLLAPTPLGKDKN